MLETTFYPYKSNQIAQVQTMSTCAPSHTNKNALICAGVNHPPSSSVQSSLKILPSLAQLNQLNPVGHGHGAPQLKIRTDVENLSVPPLRPTLEASVDSSPLRNSGVEIQTQRAAPTCSYGFRQSSTCVHPVGLVVPILGKREIHILGE